jgi:hypothetical protein
MKKVRKAAIAISAFACAAIFSFDWSKQDGILMSVESAQARVGRPLTPLSVRVLLGDKHDAEFTALALQVRP